MKRYNADPAKQKQRQALKEMIQSTLLTFLKPEKIYPLCFPGIDGMEVIEVYDALRIPRNNITCLERYKHLIPKIKQIIPGVNFPQHHTLEGYLEANKSLPHNVVSLDFTQNISPNTLTISSQSACNIGHKNYIFHAAFQKARESAKSQDFMSLANVKDELLNQLVDKMHNKDESSTRNRTYDIEENREIVLRTIWDSVNTSSPHNIRQQMINLFGPKTNEILSKAIKNEAESFRKEGIEDLADDLIREVDEAKDISTHQQTLSFLDHAILREAHEYVEAIIFSQLLFSAHGSLPIKVREQIPGWSGHVIVSFVQRGNPKCYRLKKLHKYEYISESGAPMIGDIGFVVTNTKIRNAQDDLLRHITPEFRIKDVSAFIAAAQRCNQVGKEVSDQTFDLDKYDTIERDFLGSAAKPVLGKKQAIDLLKSGVTQQEIMEKYRIRPRRLAALKAHITMGTYNQ